MGKKVGRNKIRSEDKMLSKLDKRLNLSEKEKQLLVEEVIEFILNEYSVTEIQKFYYDTRGYAESTMLSYIQQAREQIALRSDIDLEMLILTHNKIYQEIVAHFKNTGYTEGLLKAMLQREKLIGLHKEETNIEVNNQTQVNIETQQTHDLTRLSIDEQNRLNQLFAKIGYDSKRIGAGD